MHPTCVTSGGSFETCKIKLIMFQLLLKFVYEKRVEVKGLFYSGQLQKKDTTL